jgi:membrane associated rhomboid family serine protease
MQPFVRRWPVGRPSATALVVALSLGAYVTQSVLQLLLKDESTWEIFQQWLALDAAGIASGHWWKFLTFGLLHSTPLHLVANMLLLYFAGREVEPIVGPRHFLAIYALGNVVGGAFQWWAMDSLLMGVSAGVAAVVVAYTTILPELEMTVNLFFVVPLRLRAKYLAYALVAVSALCWQTMTGSEYGPAGIIAASLFAWAYVKQLGYGNPLPIQRLIFERRQRAARLQRMSAEQFLTAEIDPILEKIAQQGMKSLTRSEKKILELGRAKMTGPPEAGK